MTTRSTVVIADDHPVLRQGLRAHLETAGGFSVVGCVGDAQSAINLCRERQPDVLLMDVEMPGRDALGAMVDVKSASPCTRIVVLTAFCRDAVIEAAVRGGASGYLLKSDPPETLLKSLALVLIGERVYSEAVADRLARGGSARGGARTLLSALTSREIEVLRSIGKGMTNGEMAEAMHLSIRTVERHVLRLMRDLRINDRTRLTALAHESGLVN
ncbi:MAG: response regulator transcription factor [Planctomycetes bacterium]|nr:response regulator transcription factor [Planctomycetota bacterium]